MRRGRASGARRRGVAVLVIAASAATAAVAYVGPAQSQVTAASPPGYVLNTTFGAGGVMTFPSWTEVRTIAVLPDGSGLVQLDRLDTGGALVATGIAKLRPDGLLDGTFAAGASTPGIVEDSAEARAALAPLIDGGFFLGGRRFSASGAVDTAYGVNGYIAFNGFRFGNAPTALVELGDGRMVVITDARASNDCYLFVVDAAGTVGPLTTTGVLCAEAIPLRMPDGSRLVVVHEVSAGYRLLRIAPTGHLDATWGTGGIVTVDPALGQSTRLLAASPTPDGKILLLPQSSLLASGVIARIDVDGALDHGFGGVGWVGFAGTAQAFTVEDNAAPLLGVGYTFQLHPTMPYHPALLRLTPSGQVDAAFNTGGLQPGWFDVTEAGITEPANGGAQARFGADSLLVGLSFGATGGSPRVAALIELAPAPAPIPATTQPGPPSTVVVEPGITRAATATATALRLNLLGPPFSPRIGPGG